MTTNITRRATLAGAAVLPLASAAALASTSNATDAAWAVLQAAKAHFEATDAKSDAFRAAFEARLPDHLKEHARPNIHDFADYDEFKALADSWNAERAGYGENPYDADDGLVEQACSRVDDAENAVLDLPVSTLVDVERKLAIISGWDGCNEIQPESIDGLLADVRRLQAGVS